jgi:uncharacterized protein (UPF0335 family)
MQKVERKLNEATEIMEEIKEILQRQNSQLVPTTSIPDNIA